MGLKRVALYGWINAIDAEILADSNGWETVTLNSDERPGRIRAKVVFDLPEKTVELTRGQVEAVLKRRISGDAKYYASLLRELGFEEPQNG